MSAKIINFVSWPDENGIIAQCCCDTAAELPAVNAFATYGTLAATSTCRVINESATYQLNTAGVWKKKTDATSVALDLSGYYTSAEVDSAISAALASYTNTADMNTAINDAIMLTQYTNRGTEPANGTDILTLTVGRYYKSQNAQTLVNIPSNFTGQACIFVIRNTTTTTGTRMRIDFYSCSPSNDPHYWFSIKAGTPAEWKAWIDITGAAL